ncbi:hypothetical protein D3C80_1693610 [compost metagenome]
MLQAILEILQLIVQKQPTIFINIKEDYYKKGEDSPSLFFLVQNDYFQIFMF